MECAFKSPVRTECGLFIMYCMQCCLSVSAVLLCVDVQYEEVYKCLQL